MAKTIKQFRYFGKSNAKTQYNYPQDISDVKLRTGSVFFEGDLAGKYIVSLRIHGTPGIKFYINNNTDPILLGWDGNYILDLTNISSITALSFDKMVFTDFSDALATQGLIIDCIYESEG